MSSYYNSGVELVAGAKIKGLNLRGKAKRLRQCEKPGPVIIRKDLVGAKIENAAIPEAEPGMPLPDSFERVGGNAWACNQPTYADAINAIAAEQVSA